MGRLVFLTIALVATAAAAQSVRVQQAAHPADADPWCESDWDSDRYVRVCEVLEIAAPAGPLDLDGHLNGSVDVTQWDRPDVLVRARIEAAAGDQARAQQLLRRVSVDVVDGVIRSHTPDTARRDGEWTAVSFEVFTPRRTDLTVGVTNGPLTLDGLEGSIRARATNGPVTVRGLGGDVRVRSQNGPVRVTLAGRDWAGAGLDVEARNGPVSLSVPAGYSARLDAATDIARIDTGGVNVGGGRRQTGRHVGDAITATLGNGGAMLRVRATNGPVALRAVE